jgi:hypothetical protein
MWFDKLTMSGARLLPLTMSGARLLPLTMSGARLLPLTLSLSKGAANSDRSFEMVSNTLSAGRNVTVPGG